MNIHPPINALDPSLLHTVFADADLSSMFLSGSAALAAHISANETSVNRQTNQSGTTDHQLIEDEILKNLCFAHYRPRCVR